LRLFAQRSRRRVFVNADAPRPGDETDAATRAIINGVDWLCRLFRRFSETNILVRRNVSEGLD